jgi:hypothetical protein
MINPPATDQAGIFNLFIDSPCLQIYGCNAVPVKRLCAILRAFIIGSSTKDPFRTDFSALVRATCQASICPWLDCRARLRNENALHFTDTHSGRVVNRQCTQRHRISTDMSASVDPSAYAGFSVYANCPTYTSTRFSVDRVSREGIDVDSVMANDSATGFHR